MPPEDTSTTCLARVGWVLPLPNKALFNAAPSRTQSHFRYDQDLGCLDNTFFVHAVRAITRIAAEEVLLRARPVERNGRTVLPKGIISKYNNLWSRQSFGCIVKATSVIQKCCNITRIAFIRPFSRYISSLSTVFTPAAWHESKG